MSELWKLDQCFGQSHGAGFFYDIGFQFRNGPGLEDIVRVGLTLELQQSPEEVLQRLDALRAGIKALIPPSLTWFQMMDQTVILPTDCFHTSWYEPTLLADSIPAKKLTLVSSKWVGKKVGEVRWPIFRKSTDLYGVKP